MVIINAGFHRAEIEINAIYILPTYDLSTHTHSHSHCITYAHKSIASRKAQAQPIQSSKPQRLISNMQDEKKTPPRLD